MSDYQHRRLQIKIEDKIVADRLEELWTELRNECISYGELVELQSLIDYIDQQDTELLDLNQA